MTRWPLILPCVVVLIGVALPAHAAERPNVLFIAVDDLRPELGCYGVKEIISPNIDRLAASGVRFNRAYCQQAVCNPSRASLMTGLRPDTIKVWDLATKLRDVSPDVVTIPQQFQTAGYYAVAYGKIFHNPFPDPPSWNEPNYWASHAKTWSQKSLDGQAAYRKRMKADGKSQAAIDRMRANATDDEDVPDSQRPDGEMTDLAIEKLKLLAAKDQPFFLGVGYVRPHLPFTAPKKYWDLYDRKTIPLATNRQIPAGSPPVAMDTMYELRDYYDFAETPPPTQGTLTEDQQRLLKHGYYASVSFTDAQIGRLLQALDAAGKASDTIVVLWGDHGWKLGEHNGWTKQTNYEIDTRVPLIVRSPGAKSNGKACDALVEFVDIYPTLCELAGVPTPQGLAGKSMAPLLDDPTQKWKEGAFSQFKRKVDGIEYMGYAMRTDRYRYVEWYDRNGMKLTATELYDHRTDPQENQSVAGEAEKSLLDQLSYQMWQTLGSPAK